MITHHATLQLLAYNWSGAVKIWRRDLKPPLIQEHNKWRDRAYYDLVFSYQSNSNLIVLAG